MGTLPVDDTLLVAYVDGELDAATHQRIADLVEQEPAVRARVAMFRRSCDLLRAALSDDKYMAVPEPLAGRANKMLKGHANRLLAWLSLPVAAAIVGLVVGNLALPPNFGVGQSSSGRLADLLEDVREYHAMFARETEHVVEVPASRREHIRAWLGDRVHYPLNVPDLTSRGLTFLGARMVALSGGVAAQLMYVDGGGEYIAICVALTEDKLNAPLQSVQKAGFEVLGEAEGHHTFIVAGPQSNPALEPIARSLPALLHADARVDRPNFGGFRARPTD